MALTLTTSGSLNTTVDNYAFSILSNTSSVQLGAVSLKLVVPGGCTIKNVNAGTSSVDSLVFLQQDGNLTIGMYTLSNWVVNTNDVILSITASGMSTGSFTLNTDEDWYCEIASSSAEPFTDFAIKIPSLASPYASVSTTLEAVSILSGVNPSITSIGAPNSSVFGSGSRTLGTASIAEGINTLASGLASHAAGINTTASGQAAFSIGIETDADGIASFAAGSGSWARGDSSVAMGIGTIASASAQVTIGHYNFPLNSPDHLFVVGGGTGASPSSRGNLLEVYGGIGSTYKAVKIDVGSTFTQTSAPPQGFSIYGNTTFNGNVTGSNFNAIGVDTKTVQDPILGIITTGSFTSNFYRSQVAPGGGPVVFENVLKASAGFDHRGINFSLSEQTTAPGSTFLWTNSSNRLFYSSSAVILNDGNTLGTTMTIGTTDTNNLQLETNNTTRVFISSSGNVGIGTTSPSAQLHISGASNSVLFEIDSPMVNNIIYVSGSGNVGIGTSNPTYQLHVSASGGTNGTIYTSNRVIAAGGTAADPTFATNSTIAGLFEPSYANLGFTSYGGEAGRIETSNRYWNIGMTGGTAKMNIRGTGATSATNTLRVENSSGIAGLIVGDDARTFVGEDYTFTSSQRYYLLEASADGLVTFTNNTTSVGQTNGFLSGELYLTGTQPFINHRAINVITTNRNTSTSNILRAFYASGRTGNSGAANTVAGFLGGVNIEGSGNVTNAIGLEIEIYSQTSNKTITNMYGVKVQPLINSVGTITNTYGLYIDSLTAGTQSNAAYGIYQAGTDKNYFAGNLGIKTTSPSASLHISGASNSGLLEIDSPAVNNIIYVSGSGNVGIGTGTPTNTLQVVGGVTATSFTGSLFGTSSWAVSSSNAITAQTASYFLGQNFATFTQSIASTTWTFNHNLSFRTPVITIYNSSYEVVIPDSITGTSDNQSVITFSTSQSGYATATVGSILPTNTTALMLAYAVVL